MPNIGEGFEYFFGGVDILFGGVIANIGGGGGGGGVVPPAPPPPENPSMYCTVYTILITAFVYQTIF